MNCLALDMNDGSKPKLNALDLTQLLNLFYEKKKKEVEIECNTTG